MIARPALLAKLSAPCRAALERAAERCTAAGQFAVDVAHLLLALGEDDASDQVGLLFR